MIAVYPLASRRCQVLRRHKSPEKPNKQLPSETEREEPDSGLSSGLWFEESVFQQRFQFRPTVFSTLHGEHGEAAKNRSNYHLSNEPPAIPGQGDHHSQSLAG
jgi:hypothetical protein